MCPHLLRTAVVLGSECPLITLEKALNRTETHCTILYSLPKPLFYYTATILPNPLALTAGDLGRFQSYMFLNPVPGYRDGFGRSRDLQEKGN